tara:strand:+ start:2053 stop:2670 length:618 start_codon:yes stop_codon:yes gene_type:complete
MNNIPRNERPATDTQIRTFVANAAADVMINSMVNGKGRETRKALKATGAKLYFQVKESLITAIKNNDDLRPTQLTIQTLISNLDSPLGIGFDELFNAGFHAMRATSDEIGQLLLKDGLSPKKAVLAAQKYAKISGKILETPTPKKVQKSATIQTRKITKKEPVKISTKPKTKSKNTRNNAPITVSDFDREIERLMILREEAEMVS